MTKFINDGRSGESELMQQEADYRPGSSLRQQDDVIGLACCVSDCGKNILFLKKRVFGKDLLVACSVTQQVEDVGDAHPFPANARSSSTFPFFNCDPVQQVHNIKLPSRRTAIKPVKRRLDSTFRVLNNDLVKPTTFHTLLTSATTLSDEKKRLSSESLQEQKIEKWRAETAVEARRAFKALHEGKLRGQSAESAIRELRTFCNLRK